LPAISACLPLCTAVIAVMGLLQAAWLKTKRIISRTNAALIYRVGNIQ
jgi:hypothetical protein